MFPVLLIPRSARRAALLTDSHSYPSALLLIPVSSYILAWCPGISVYSRAFFDFRVLGYSPLLTVRLPSVDSFVETHTFAIVNLMYTIFPRVLEPFVIFVDVLSTLLALLVPLLRAREIRSSCRAWVFTSCAADATQPERADCTAPATPFFQETLTPLVEPELQDVFPALVGLDTLCFRLTPQSGH